jgi:hypothetical protein
MHVYEVRPRKDKRGVDLLFDALPFGGIWYGASGSRRECNPPREAPQRLTWMR